MSFRLSSRLVSPTVINNLYCNFSAAQNGDIAVPINIKECSLSGTYGKFKEAKLFIPQSSDRIFRFVDTNASTDFTTLSEATFEVWSSVTSGSTSQFAKSLSSGITIPNADTLQVDIDNTDTSIDPGRYYFELWVTTTAADRYLVKFGDFTVEDTRKYDV